jgi:hypothetical protein
MDHATLEDEIKMGLKMLGTNHPVMWHYTPQEW